MSLMAHTSLTRFRCCWERADAHRQPHSGHQNWTYTFFVDLIGHHDDDNVASAHERARAHCHELHVLGSYPRSKRIL